MKSTTSVFGWAATTIALLSTVLTVGFASEFSQQSRESTTSSSSTVAATSHQQSRASTASSSSMVAATSYQQSPARATSLPDIVVTAERPAQPVALTARPGDLPDVLVIAETGTVYTTTHTGQGLPDLIVTAQSEGSGAVVSTGRMNIIPVAAKVTTHQNTHNRAHL